MQAMHDMLAAPHPSASRRQATAILAALHAASPSTQDMLLRLPRELHADAVAQLQLPTRLARLSLARAESPRKRNQLADASDILATICSVEDNPPSSLRLSDGRWQLHPAVRSRVHDVLQGLTSVQTLDLAVDLRDAALPTSVNVLNALLSSGLPLLSSLDLRRCIFDTMEHTRLSTLLQACVVLQVLRLPAAAIAALHCMPQALRGLKFLRTIVVEAKHSNLNCMACQNLPESIEEVTLSCSASDVSADTVCDAQAVVRNLSRRRRLRALSLSNMLFAPLQRGTQERQQSAWPFSNLRRLSVSSPAGSSHSLPPAALAALLTGSTSLHELSLSNHDFQEGAQLANVVDKPLLQSLTLQCCKLQHVPAGSWEQLGRLQQLHTLDLRHNALKAKQKCEVARAAGRLPLLDTLEL